MSDAFIKVEDLGKLYKLGQIGTGTISHDLNRWWAKIRGKQDPFAKVGLVNDRTQSGASDYVWALKDINFEVKQGEVLGIIGRNGAGKSTLLKILSKVTTPSRGQIKVKGRIASLLEVGTGFHPELTGRENIYLNGAILGMTRGEVKSKFDEIVDFAGVERYIDTPVKRYSSGMYVRLAFSVAAFLEPEILIVDEVLAVGDAEFQKKCLGRMKDVSVNQGRTVLFVSHQLDAIQLLCENCIVLENGRIGINCDTRNAINFYNGNSNIGFKKIDNYLKWVKIYQLRNSIILEAEYDSDINFDIPHLGFVIYNSLGYPIFGSNPTIERLVPNQILKGILDYKIKVEILEPKLLDGEYRLGIWFGDSKENFFSNNDLISFAVSGMTPNKQFPVSVVGSVSPSCTWDFL